MECHTFVPSVEWEWMKGERPEQERWFEQPSYMVTETMVTSRCTDWGLFYSSTLDVAYKI